MAEYLHQKLSGEAFMQTKLDDSTARRWIEALIDAGGIKLLGPSHSESDNLVQASTDAAYLLTLLAALQKDPPTR